MLYTRNNRTLAYSFNKRPQIYQMHILHQELKFRCIKILHSTSFRAGSRVKETWRFSDQPLSDSYEFYWLYVYILISIQ